MENNGLNHLQLAELSELAYLDSQHEIKTKLNKLYPGQVHALHHFKIKKTDTEGFSAIINDEFINVGTGTDSLKDLLIDILAFKSNFKIDGTDVKLHSGFKLVHNDLYEESLDIYYKPSIFEKLYNYEIKQITYTGHSLGAFVAQSLAIHLNNHSFINEIPIKIVTFGCPGGWDKYGACEMDRLFPSFTRYENSFDCVTWIPASSYWAGKAIKLKGKKGHNIKKYINNLRKCKS